MRMETSGRFTLRVRGPYACFTRPEMKVERVSYEVMTPSAARGVVDAILWKPAIKWRVHEIHVLAPIRWASFRRNEVNSRANPRAEVLVADEDRTQRSTVALRDVDYGLVVSFEMTPQAGPGDNVKKFEDIFQRRLARGQQAHQPYLGCREFAAEVMPLEVIPPAIDPGVTRPLGWMFFDYDYVDGAPKQRPMFFDARLADGVVIVPSREEVRRAEDRGP